MMKLNFTVNITDYNDDIQTIEYKIISEAARQLITEVMSNTYEHYGRTFKQKLQDEVKRMLVDVMDKDFKEEVKNNLVEELSKKYIKTKQYKEIKKQFDISSDSEIKSGLKDIVSELVESKMKNMFK